MIDDKFYIHPFTEDPILNYLEWKDAAFNPTIGSGEKERLKSAFYRSKEWSKMQFQSENMDAMRNAFRKYYGQSPT